MNTTITMEITDLDSIYNQCSKWVGTQRDRASLLQNKKLMFLCYSFQRNAQEPLKQLKTSFKKVLHDFFKLRKSV